MFCFSRNGWTPKGFAGTNRNKFSEAEKNTSNLLANNWQTKAHQRPSFYLHPSDGPTSCTLLSIIITALLISRPSFPLLLLHSSLVELDNPLALPHSSLFVRIFFLYSHLIFFPPSIFTWKPGSGIDQSSGCCRLASETSPEHTLGAIFSPPCYF